MTYNDNTTTGINHNNKKIIVWSEHRDRSIHIEREGMVGVPEKLRDKLKK